MSMFLYSLSILSMAVSIMGQIDWANDYDGQLYFECPAGFAINHIQSIHDNGHEDRIWGFECSESECNGPTIKKSLLAPKSLAVAPDGSVFVADHNLIRRITPEGIVTTLLQLK